MASQKKINKLKNSYCFKTTLKEKKSRIKRLLFFTASARRQNNDKNLIEKETEE